MILWNDRISKFRDDYEISDWMPKVIELLWNDRFEIKDVENL